MEKKSVIKNDKKTAKKNIKKELKKKKKGFTLIELLAVIVILGLLMAIAIPSVTKYITQSRKKTVVSSIDGYVSSIVNSVNDQDYSFTGSNTIYAVPIECVSLEKGGKNPFGEWLQANSDYWAYVLVQYNPEDFSYTYGFTFKDSAGYGMYPTVLSEINPKSSTQIKIGLNLKQPKSGDFSNIAAKDDWVGFNIQDDTQVVVLDSTEENADGQTTCLLLQKGKNYEQIKDEQKVVIKTISLKSASNTYQIEYEDGMTWGEWLNSKYNTMNFYSFHEGLVGIDELWLTYNCPFVTDINATNFTNAFVNMDEPIFEDNPYKFGSGDGIIDYWIYDLNEFDHYILKNPDGTLKYVKN